MDKSTSFESLIVWQKAHQFVLRVYKLTEDFAKSKTYGLCNQFRRASVSTPTNSAEGYKKKGIKDKLRFFNIAQGSLEESRYYLILTKDLKYSKDVSEEIDLIIEVSKLLNANGRAILNSITSKY